MVARSLIAFNATVYQKLSRGSRLGRTQGSEFGSRRRKKGRRAEGRGEQKSSRKVAKTLRRNCAKFVGISAEIRQLPPSAFPYAHRATSFLERRGRARERRGPHCTRRPDLSRQFPRQSLTALAQHYTHARDYPWPECWPNITKNVGLKITKTSKTERLRNKPCLFSLFRSCAQFPPTQHTLSRRLLSFPLPSPGNGQFVFIPVAA